MAITVPDGCWRQIGETVADDATGRSTRDVIIKGGYDSLAYLKESLHRGDTVIDGWVANALNLKSVAAGGGILTITCVAARELLSDKWKIRSVRNDVSIFAFCGDSADNPNRAKIEAWQKEPDGYLAAEHKYKRPDGQIEDLSNDHASMALIKKLEKGVESVIRFYPLLIRERVYSGPPPACLENLGKVNKPNVGGGTSSGGEIGDHSGDHELGGGGTGGSGETSGGTSGASGGTGDTSGSGETSGGDDAPGAFVEDAQMPDTLAEEVAKYEWLKVQDDEQQNDDGNWSRVESWMGILKTDGNEHPWDPDLYGPDGWDMPAAVGGGDEG